MTTPTQEEKRFAIAESLGIPKIFTLKKRGLFWRHEGRGYTSKESEAWRLTEEEATKHRLSTPDYFTSLDACHQAENALTLDQFDDYRENLMILVLEMLSVETGREVNRAYVSAGPELRAEALWRVLCRESQACATGVKESEDFTA